MTLSEPVQDKEASTDDGQSDSVDENNHQRRREQMRLRVYQSEQNEDDACVEQLDGTYAPMSKHHPTEEPDIVWSITQRGDYATHPAPEDNDKLIGYLTEDGFEPVEK